MFHVLDILTPINNYFQENKVDNFLGLSIVEVEEHQLVLTDKSGIPDLLKDGFPGFYNFGTKSVPNLNSDSFIGVSYLLLDFVKLPKLAEMRESLYNAITDLEYRLYDFMEIGYDDVHLLTLDADIVMVLQDWEVGSFKVDGCSIKGWAEPYSLLFIYALYKELPCKLNENYMNGEAKEISLAELEKRILN